MKEIKVFNLFFDPNLGFDDRCVQDWLGTERILVKQQSFLLDNHQGQILVLVVESELLKVGDPYLQTSHHLSFNHYVNTPNNGLNQTAGKGKTIRKAIEKDKNESVELTQELASLQLKKDRRKRKRAQYKKDTEAALIRLDDRGRLLVDVLRSWRSTMATELGIPVYELGSDLFFCEVAL